MLAENIYFPKDFLSRSKLILTIAVILFSVLFLRVVYLSFFNNNITEAKYETRIQRGVIYDRRGMELALSHDSSTVGINPEEIEVYDRSFTAEKLSQATSIPKEKIESLILEKDKYFLLKREIDNNSANRIKNMALPGVRIEKEYKRIYPNGTLASNLLGFTGMDDNKALSGLELIYNNELLTPTDSDLPRGYDLHLTIDSLIQYRLEAALGKAYKETGSKKAVGIFMEVSTGKILAMANFPNFDPNNYAESPVESTTNWAIRHVYEPGSTMKIFMVMFLLNEKLVTLDEKFFCPGYVEFGDRVVRCAGAHGIVDLDEILQYSCNVGIIKAIQKIKDDKLFKYMSKFKFGQRTGFTDYEYKGFLPARKDWTQSTSFYMSIGQGIEVTPLQLVNAAAALVNGGKIYTPRLLTHITDAYGDIVRQYQSEYDTISLRDDAKEHVLRAMTKVVKLGTGKNAYTQNYEISGKTGTSQKAKPGKGYIEGLISASFLGYFPAKKPQIVGLILLDEPESDSHSGGAIAAPVFKEVVESIVPILDFKEEANTYTLKTVTQKEILEPTNKVPNLKGKSVTEVISIAQKYNARFKLKGSGYCIAQEPEFGEKFIKDEVWTIRFE
ncbi:MAG: penicillin-binding transpeptidase domain-containing protein [Leptospiraceae bacterium]|nr:penicillin-binding transpeptidase domain-containing protein [Leptospiraceae bacterium]